MPKRVVGCLVAALLLAGCTPGEGEYEIVLRDQASVQARQAGDLTPEELSFIALYDSMDCPALSAERLALRNAFYEATQHYIENFPDGESITQRLYLTETWRRRPKKPIDNPILHDELLNELRAQLDAASMVERRKGCLTPS